MKDDTKLTHAGLAPFDNEGIINPPVYHASTVLAENLDTFEGRIPARVRYGRSGTPTTFALEEALTALEEGAGTVLTPSGLSAVSLALLACVEAGDHALIADSVYSPTRNFCEGVLTRFGVEVEYYDPLIGGAIGGFLRPNTKVVFTESPGSQTFEVQDMPAIAAAAHAADGSLTSLDARVGALRAGFQMHAQDKTNRRLGMLTILSAIFMPITLLAGIWGMNFEVMPELKVAYAYPVALGFMVIVGAAMYLFFRRTGWFD